MTQVPHSQRPAAIPVVPEPTTPTAEPPTGQQDGSAPDPNRCFGGEVIVCPDCGHGIDPHGVNPGGACGDNCPCMMQPNGIASLYIDRLERELRAAVEALERRGTAAPLGYLVLSRNPETGRLGPQGRVHDQPEHAEDWRRHLESTPGPLIPIRPGTKFLIGEIHPLRRDTEETSE